MQLEIKAFAVNCKAFVKLYESRVGHCVNASSITDLQFRFSLLVLRLMNELVIARQVI